MKKLLEERIGKAEARTEDRLVLRSYDASDICTPYLDGSQPLENLAQRTMQDIRTMVDAADDPGVSSSQRSTTSEFMGDVGSLDNFSIPVFDNPAELFNVFKGDPVRLVEWRMPTFKFEFTYTQSIPIFGPLSAQFGGTIGAKINIGFGYDTYGIQKYIEAEDKKWWDILDATNKWNN